MVIYTVKYVQESSSLEEIDTSFHTTHALLFWCKCTMVKEGDLELQEHSPKCIQAHSLRFDLNHDQRFWAGCAGKLLPKKNVHLFSPSIPLKTCT